MEKITRICNTTKQQLAARGLKAPGLGEILVSEDNRVFWVRAHYENHGGFFSNTSGGVVFEDDLVEVHTVCSAQHPSPQGMAYITKNSEKSLRLSVAGCLEIR